MFKAGYALVFALVVTLFAGAVLSSPVEGFAKNFDDRPTRPTRPTRTPRTTTQPTTVRPPPDVIQTEGCGGVLDGNTGLISYRLNEKLLETGEVCIWTIRSPSSGQIQIQLDHDGFSQDGGNSKAYIAVFSVGEDAILQKSHKILSGDSNIYIINGQVGYIIFRSSASFMNENETGFQLYFEGDSSAGQDESEWTGRNNSHVHFHLSETNGVREQFAYPPVNASGGSRERYRPNEFGSWIVNPEGTKMINTLTLYYIDFEDFSFSDYINIHQVDGDSPKLLDRKFNTNTYFSSSFKYDTVREPFIITFHSDERNERTGFILYYSNDRYSMNGME